MKKYLLVIAITVLSVFCFMHLTYSQDSIKIILDGKILNISDSYTTPQGRVMAPLRAISQEFGVDLEWDGASKIVTGTKGNIKVVLQIGNKKVKVNGITVEIDTAPTLINGKTFVPLRTICEYLGTNVAWDGSSKTITIAQPDNAAESNLVMRVGLDDTFPPMEFKDKDDKIIGFDIDIANEIGKRVNKEVEFVSIPWNGIFAGLNTGKFDCIVSAASFTEQRTQVFGATKPYIVNGLVALANNKGSVLSINDLKDKKVGVQIGSSADEYCGELSKTIPIEIRKYDMIEETLSNLENGNTDAVICDEITACYYITNVGRNLKIVSDRLTNDPIVIYFEKSNTSLKDSVSKVLEDMRADGSLKRLSEKWFGKDLTD